jgi:hypothetical protein
MVRFFERNGEQLQCELRPSLNAAGFDMELVSADGQKQVQHAADENALALKWLELEDRLKREGWVVVSERRSGTP